jgi:hypothetical protein
VPNNRNVAKEAEKFLKGTFLLKYRACGIRRNVEEALRKMRISGWRGKTRRRD